MSHHKFFDWCDGGVTCVGLVSEIPVPQPETITAGELIKQLRKFKPGQPVYYQKRSGKLIPIRYAEIPSVSPEDDPLGWLSARIKA